MITALILSGVIAVALIFAAGFVLGYESKTKELHKDRKQSNRV